MIGALITIGNFLISLTLAIIFYIPFNYFIELYEEISGWRELQNIMEDHFEHIYMESNSIIEPIIVGVLMGIFILFASLFLIFFPILAIPMMRYSLGTEGLLEVKRKQISDLEERIEREEMSKTLKEDNHEEE